MAMSVYSLKGRTESVQISLDRPWQCNDPKRQCHGEGGSAAPCKNGKATHYIPDQTKPMKKVSQ